MLGNSLPYCKERIGGPLLKNSTKRNFKHWLDLNNQGMLILFYVKTFSPNQTAYFNCCGIYIDIKQYDFKFPDNHYFCTQKQ